MQITQTEVCATRSLLYTRAIVRPPVPNFAEGLTTVDLGVPDYHRALEQHSSYCAALERCGLTLITLEPDSRFPDSTFVEDTAVLTKELAVLTRPGAPSRGGEVESIARSIRELFPVVETLSESATLDGGDICEAGTHFFIGVSERTNEIGAHELASLLKRAGYTSTLVDIRNERDILHLKSGIAYLSGGRLAVTEPLSRRPEFRGFELLIVPIGEDYAANCIEINDAVLIPAGFPKTEKALGERGYQTLALDMSEFQKMDGGLSCLSLRF